MNKKKKKMGRPRKGINFEEFKKLCGLQCTEEEIAGFFDIGVTALVSRINEKYSMTFQEAFKRFSSNGKISLRRTQFKLAKKSAAMAIWLGKQYLGQAERVEVVNESLFDQKIELFEPAEIKTTEGKNRVERYLS